MQRQYIYRHRSLSLIANRSLSALFLLYPSKLRLCRQLRLLDKVKTSDGPFTAAGAGVGFGCCGSGG